ncbi:MAG: response regulator, partial [Gammaproteobacteria bacterium]|nr:response regulator [Gammaproteobacteria bacterium]
LFISRELASRLGGEIQVATELGKGSTFTLLLNSDHHITQDSSAPASLEEKAAKSNKQASIFLPYNYRILVAEDTKDTQFLVRTILESVGANVTLVENGKDAVEKVLSSIAAGQEYDAVLMDINMPLLDGYAATRKLREQRYAGLIIALTAHARPEDKEKCMAAGCDDYLSKPIKLNELVKLLRKHVYE